ncbi:MAG: DUF5659 domain-containing protein [Candidatus Omnitrophota bacterium]
MKDDNGFEIKDIFEASFLYAKLNTPPKIRVDASAKFCWFVFPDTKKCEDLLSDYWNRRATIDPKGYADAFRSLKDMIFRGNIGYTGGRRP